MYLKRNIDHELQSWTEETGRKPLLIRGARQVGKSSSVRKLGESFELFLEINFEEQKDVHSLFQGDLTPQALCENLSVMFDTAIVPGKTLLFFDEIQACLPAISSLRFFYEKLPELHVVAAGSLLEFALNDIPSFGVGRIRSVYMFPLSFDEFLTGTGQTKLLELKSKAGPQNPLPAVFHEKLLDLLKKFLVLGGMPEVVTKYVAENDIRKCQRILDDLISSYQTDFSKYKARIPASRIREMFKAVVLQAGGKFVFRKASRDLNTGQIKEALELLIMSGLVLPVTHTSANGIPLGADIDPKKRKMLLLDTGIFQRLLKLNISDLIFNTEFNLVNKGGIAEQFLGLEIVKSASCYEQTDLYYWHREALNSNAEVDYLIQKNSDIVPIEVKSGTKGSMKSMHLFLQEKGQKYGCRFSLENFAEYHKIKVFPLYAYTNTAQITL
ncbi:MAG: ATP-binding protein [Bacteroidales bacterium]|nr:ATP-binding protein [Bacteroidales bacterium]